MKLALFSLTILGLIVQQSFAPPVTNNKEEEPKDDENRVQVENELVSKKLIFLTIKLIIILY